MHLCQPTVELYPGLLAHIRRWKRLGISNQSVIEYNGKPVASAAGRPCAPTLVLARTSCSTRCATPRSHGCSGKEFRQATLANTAASARPSLRSTTGISSATASGGCSPECGIVRRRWGEGITTLDQWISELKAELAGPVTLREHLVTIIAISLVYWSVIKTKTQTERLSAKIDKIDVKLSKSDGD